MALPDVLQWLAQSRKTGTLFLTRDGLTKRFYVEDGCVTAATGQMPDDRLGQFLLERGLIKKQSLERALELQKSRSAFIGKILVEIGCISESTVEKALRFKIQETLLEVLDWADGQFNFVEHNPPDKSRLPISIEVPDLLLNSMQHIDESASESESSKPNPRASSASRPLAPHSVSVVRTRASARPRVHPPKLTERANFGNRHLSQYLVLAAIAGVLVTLAVAGVRRLRGEPNRPASEATQPIPDTTASAMTNPANPVERLRSANDYSEVEAGIGEVPPRPAYESAGDRELPRVAGGARGRT